MDVTASDRLTCIQQKMNKKWPPDRTLRFIKAYKHHECLWDITKEIYKDREMRDAAYTALSAEFDINVMDVKTKIKNLRATYFQEVKKVNESMRIAYRSEDVYKPNLIWFSEMESFIKSMPNSVKNEIILSSELNESSIEEFVIKEEPLPDFSSDSELPPLSLRTPTQMMVSTNNNNREKNKRKKLDESCNFQIFPSQQIDDEFDVFGKHVACQLRRLSICRALEVQTKIQFLLSKERSKEINENRGNDQNRGHNSPTSSLGDLEQSTSSSFDPMSTF